MSSLDFDLDGQMISLESEWRQAYETGIVARADYEALQETVKAEPRALARALKRLDSAEALKARIMAKIERLEDAMLGQD